MATTGIFRALFVLSSELVFIIPPEVVLILSPEVVFIISPELVLLILGSDKLSQELSPNSDSISLWDIVSFVSLSLMERQPSSCIIWLFLENGKAVVVVLAVEVVLRREDNNC